MTWMHAANNCSRMSSMTQAMPRPTSAPGHPRGVGVCRIRALCVWVHTNDTPRLARALAPQVFFILLALATVAEATVGFCNDKDISCASWSRDGLCESDTVVKELCPHSCGVCSLMCSDRDESCASWAKQGECTSSPDYMLKECPTSCGLCTPKCADVHPDCNHWGKEGQCESNPGFMNMHCPSTCGVCKPTCRDQHDDCPGW